MFTALRSEVRSGETHIIPDRSLTFSNWRHPHYLPKPSGFQRLLEILDILLGMGADPLDRQAVPWMWCWSLSRTRVLREIRTSTITCTTVPTAPTKGSRRSTATSGPTSNGCLAAATTNMATTMPLTVFLGDTVTVANSDTLPAVFGSVRAYYDSMSLDRAAGETEGKFQVHAQLINADDGNGYPRWIRGGAVRPTARARGLTPRHRHDLPRNGPTPRRAAEAPVVGRGPGAGPDSPGSCDDEHSQGASSFLSRALHPPRTPHPLFQMSNAGFLCRKSLCHGQQVHFIPSLTACFS